MVGDDFKHVAHVIEAQAVFRHDMPKAALVVRLPRSHRPLEVRKILPSNVARFVFVLYQDIDDPVWNLNGHRSDFLGRIEHSEGPAHASPHRPQPLRLMSSIYDLKRAGGRWLDIPPGKAHHIFSLLSRRHPIMKHNRFAYLLGALLDDEGIERRRIVLDAVPSDELKSPPDGSRCLLARIADAEGKVSV